MNQKSHSKFLESGSCHHNLVKSLNEFLNLDLNNIVLSSYRLFGITVAGGRHRMNSGIGCSKWTSLPISLISNSNLVMDENYTIINTRIGNCDPNDL